MKKYGKLIGWILWIAGVVVGIVGIRQYSETDPQRTLAVAIFLCVAVFLGSVPLIVET